MSASFKSPIYGYQAAGRVRGSFTGSTSTSTSTSGTSNSTSMPDIRPIRPVRQVHRVDQAKDQSRLSRATFALNSLHDVAVDVDAETRSSMDLSLRSYDPISTLNRLIAAGLGSVPQDEILPWQREAALRGEPVPLTPRQRIFAHAEFRALDRSDNRK